MCLSKNQCFDLISEKTLMFCDNFMFPGKLAYSGTALLISSTNAQQCVYKIWLDVKHSAINRYFAFGGWLKLAFFKCHNLIKTLRLPATMWRQ
jgi:hypothetical protein